MANSYLNKTASNGERKKCTFSAWVKKGLSGSDYPRIFSSYIGASDYLRFNFNRTTDGEQLQLYIETSGAAPTLLTNRLFRDPSAWYHLVFAIDTTLATADDRMKLYVNGVQETSFATRTNPSQNQDFPVNSSSATMYIGRQASSSAAFFNGYMSHVSFVDGQALAPTVFGSTDSTSGIWKFKAPSGVTWGTNGFHLKFENSGAMGTDSSGNTNTFTVNGNLKQALDTPSNVYTTMNPLVNVPTGTYSNGNTQFNAGAEHRTGYGTLAFSTGKYYWEAKATGGSKYTIGLSDAENQSAYQQVSGANLIVGNSANSYLKGDAIGWYYTTLYKNGSTVASSIHQIVTNDIMMIACDADSGKIYYGVNGTWRVANSTTFNASSNDTTFTTGRFYVPACSNENCGWQFNFGNGYFGTTAISSAGSNGNGSLFEYDVPSGYYALNTKNINTYG